MYIEIEDQIVCSLHGGPVYTALHLFVGGNPAALENTWIVCVHCAERMDRDPSFKESMRPLFEGYQCATQGIPDSRAGQVSNRPVTYSPFLKQGQS
jgi:hypothetical protein